MKIKIKSINNYTALDLVKYFKEKFKDYYDIDHCPLYPKECSIMQRIQWKFYRAKKSNENIIEFLKWAFETKSKNKKISIGLLEKLADDYFKIHGYIEYDVSLFPTEEEEERLDAEMEEWLKEERKKWRE